MNNDNLRIQNAGYEGTKRSTPIGKLIITLIIVVVMICSFIPAILFRKAYIKTEQRGKRCTMAVKAEVVRNVSETRGETDDEDFTTYTVYAPVYSFVAGDDIPHEVTGCFNRDKPKYNVGDTVEIFVNPDDLTEYWEHGYNEWNFLAVPLSLIIPLFNIVIILVIRKMIKNNKTAHPAAEER